MLQFPVVIVGGGPVGMMLALSLARLGTRSLLVNTETTSRWFPKGSSHNARTMEHYRRLGFAQSLRKLGLPAEHPTDVGFFTTLAGYELARIEMPSEAEKAASVASPEPTAQVPEPIFRCNQMYVERFLFDRVKSEPLIEARFGWRCTDFSETADRVTVTIEAAAGGERQEIEASYIAACEGPQGLIRRRLGIAYSGDVPEEQVYGSGATMASHLRAPALYNVLKHKRCWQYRIVNPNVRSNLVTLDGGGEFTINTKLRTPDERINPEAVANLIRAGVGENIDIEFIAHRPWTAGHALVATKFGSGRIVLAGDAVHVFTPTGGFGMNTGIDDAVNLAWKLAALCGGWGGPNLLGSYEVERRPIALRNTGMAKELSRMMGRVEAGEVLLEASAAGDAARARIAKPLLDLSDEFDAIGIQLGARYDDSPVVISDGSTPPSDDPFTYRPTACPGGRAPHLFFPDGSSLWDHIGAGFCIMVLGGDHDIQPLQDAARARGIPMSSLDVRTKVARDLYECDLALVRPDLHVAWRGSRLPAACGDLLARATGW